MTEQSTKPIWIRSPISILFDVIKLKKTHPWDIDLKTMLDIIIAEIREVGHVEFEASGVALLSSAIIFRKKSELLLKLEEPPKPVERKEESTIVLPEPISLPVTVPHGKLSISDLAQALMEAILIQMPEKREEMQETIPPLLEQPDEFMVNLDKYMKEIEERIRNLLIGKDVVDFNNIVEGMTLIEVVRTFIILLFLATSRLIGIHQDQETKEIWIGLGQEEAEHDGPGRRTEDENS